MTSFFDTDQTKFYEWSHRNGFSVDYALRGVADNDHVGIIARLNALTDVRTLPVHWTRDDFKRYIEDNPEDPDLWKFRVGARFSPAKYGTAVTHTYFSFKEFFVGWLGLMTIFFGLLLAVPAAFMGAWWLVVIGLSPLAVFFIRKYIAHSVLVKENYASIR